MRLGSMLLGGLIGATAVMVAAKKRPAALEAVSDAVCSTAKSISGKSMEAVDSIRHMKWKKQTKQIIPKFLDEAADAVEHAAESMKAAADSSLKQMERSH